MKQNCIRTIQYFVKIRQFGKKFRVFTTTNFHKFQKLAKIYSKPLFLGLPEMTSYEQARGIIGTHSKPLAMVVEALGQENRLSRLEKSAKLNVDAKLFFQKVRSIILN
jgi:hypothetical protein